MNHRRSIAVTRMGFTLLATMLAAVFYLPYTRADEDKDCDAILKAGIVNETVLKTNTNLRRSFDQYIYDAEFKTHDEAIDAGISVGTVVYGVPLQVGGTFKDTDKETWYKQHTELKRSQVALSEQYSLLVKEISPDLLRAWLECKKHSFSAKAPFSAMLVGVDRDTAVLFVTWNPPSGDRMPPKVLSSDIAGGKRLGAKDDALAGAAFDRDQILATGVKANRALLTRTPGKGVAVVIRTTRGDVSDYLPAYVELPVVKEFSASKSVIVAGQSTQVKWVVDGVSGVTINGGKQNATGSLDVTPASTTTYRLIAKNDGGAIQRETTVTVIQPPDPKEWIVNGGAEEGLKGWECPTGHTWSTEPETTPRSGKHNFWPGKINANSELRQIVDISSMGDAVDRGIVHCDFSGWVSTYTQRLGDDCQIIVQFEDEKGKEVRAQLDSGRILHHDGWKQVAWPNESVPKGCRKIRVRLLGWNRDGVTDAYFDDISLKFHLPK